MIIFGYWGKGCVLVGVVGWDGMGVIKKRGGGMKIRMESEIMKGRVGDISFWYNFFILVVISFIEKKVLICVNYEKLIV